MWNKGTTQTSTSYYYYHTPTSTPAPARSVKHDTGRTCLRSPQPQQDLSNMTQAGLTWAHPNPSRNCLSPEITPTPAGAVSHTGRRPDLLDSTPTPAGTVSHLRVPQPQQELSLTWEYPNPSRNCHLRVPQPQQELSPESTPTPAGTVTWEYPNPSRNCHLRVPQPQQELSPESTPTPAGTVTWEYPNPSRNCHTGRRPDLPESTPTPAGTVTQDRDQTYLRVPQPQQELSHRTQTRPTWQYPNPSRNCHTGRRPDLPESRRQGLWGSRRTRCRPAASGRDDLCGRAVGTGPGGWCALSSPWRSETV